MIKALMLQCFMLIPSERALAEELAGSRDYRRIVRLFSGLFANLGRSGIPKRQAGCGGHRNYGFKR
jgi:hypothetical protein